MSASAFQPGDVPWLYDTEYKGARVYTDPDKAPVVFLWWAKTPTGRQSKYTVTRCFERLQFTTKTVDIGGGFIRPVLVPTEHYGRTTAEIYKWLCERGARNCCPSLPRGYSWQGPFLCSETDAPTEEGPKGRYWFAFKAPAKSAGIAVRYVVDSPLHTAHTLASAVLAARAGAAA